MYPNNRHVRLYNEQAGQCFYCRRPLLIVRAPDHPARACTIDHKVPRCRGGGAGDNLVGACGECNDMKGSLTDLEFLPLLKMANGNKGRLRDLCMAAMYPDCKLARRLRGERAVQAEKERIVFVAAPAPDIYHHRPCG